MNFCYKNGLLRLFDEVEESKMNKNKESDFYVSNFIVA